MAKPAAKPDRKSAKPAPKKTLLARKPAETGRKLEPKRSVPTKLWDYLKNVRSELRKVIWPKRPEVITSSIVVVATLIVIGIYVTLLDGIFEFLVNTITGVGPR